MDLQITGSGVDSLGSFKFYVPGNCGVCKKANNVVVTYAPVTIKRGLGDIKRESTLLKDTPHLGLTCGCYAKFHRQVAHIRDRQQAKSAKRR